MKRSPSCEVLAAIQPASIALSGGVRAAPGGTISNTGKPRSSLCECETSLYSMSRILLCKGIVRTERIMDAKAAKGGKPEDAQIAG